MRFKLLVMFLLFLPVEGFYGSEEPKKVITFRGGSRLGDKILDYVHAKWLSYEYGFPLLFKTFEYSDQFIFDDYEEKLTPEKQALYRERTIKSLTQLNEEVSIDTLYVLVHACDSYDEYLFNGSFGTYVPVNWEDESFRNMMRTLIAPKYPLVLIEPPPNCVSVALHYRTGGGFVKDTDATKRRLPLRFPEVEYYIEQLTKLHSLLGEEDLYVHIFTDHPQPDEIRAIFKQYFPQKNITFGCRINGNRHDANVLEDLFSMMKFDCLIRPMSHYSMTASHLGDFKIEFFPAHGYWKMRKFVVDQVKVIEKATRDTKNKCWVLKAS